MAPCTRPINYTPAPFSLVPLEAIEAIGILTDPLTVLNGYVSPRRESVKFEGMMIVEAAQVGQPIEIIAHADDGVRITIDGQVVIDDFYTAVDWYTPGSIRVCTFTPIRKGEHVTLIEYSDIIKLSSGDEDGIIVNIADQATQQPIEVSTSENHELPPHNPTVSSQSDPTYLNTGDYFYTHTDLRIPGRGFDFVFKRFYRSRLNYSGPLGYGWEHNYNKRIQKHENGTDLVLFHGYREPRSTRDVGHRFSDAYTPAGPDVWEAPPGFFNKILKQPDGTYILREPDQFEYHFFGFNNQKWDGKLQKMTDRNGNEMQFQYDTYGYLVRVVDTLGRSIYFDVDAFGRIVRIRDFSGRAVNFAYNNQQDLISVTSPVTSDFPSGKTTQYSYSSGFTNFSLNHNLLAVTDPKGQTYLTNTYGTNVNDPDTFDKVISQVYGSGAISYQYFPDQQFTKLTDRNGNILDYGYNDNGNPTFVKEYTNRDIRLGDPDFYLTAFEHNMHYDRTKTVLPKGNTIERAFDSASLDIFQRGNLLRLTRRPFDGAADTSSLTHTFTYTTDFNFIRSAADPKGNTTLYSYDPKGNVTLIEYPTITVPVAQTITKSFTYNSFGQITEATKGEGNKNCFEYHDAGPSLGYLKKSISDCGMSNFNLTTEYSYDSVGNITFLIDPKGNTATFEVNTLNQVTKSIAPSPFNFERRFTYDANDNLIQADVQNKDKDGVLDPLNPWLTTTYTYDSLDKVISRSEDDPTVTTTYEYDPNENLRRIILPEGNKTLYTYDERNLIYQITRGEGATEASTVTADYDLNGNVSLFTNGRGYSTSYSFDLFDRPISLANAVGGIASREYDRNSNPIRTRFDGKVTFSDPFNSRLSESFFSFDELNRPYKIERAFFDAETQTNFGDGRQTTQAFYDRNHRLIKAVDELNHQRLYEYDSANRLRRTIDHLNNEREFIYDANSNVINTIDWERSQLGGPAELFINAFTYDSLDRLIRTQDNLAQIRDYAYDSRGNTTYMIDAKGNTTTFDYDGLNRLTRTIYDLRDGGGAPGGVVDTIVTQRTWDRNSRLASLTDDNNNNTLYIYDPLNRLSSMTFADNSIFAYTYDANDNLLTTTDPNGSVITYNHDTIDRIFRRLITPGAGVGGPVTEIYHHDGLTRLIGVGNTLNSQFITYDSLSNLRTERQGFNTVTSDFNSISNRTNLTYPGGTSLDFTRDELNRIRNINEGINTLAHYDYIGPALRVTRRDYLNGTRFTPSYDDIKRVTKVIHEKLSPLTTLADFRYGFDAEHNRLYEQKKHSPWLGKGDRYNYDSLYRVVEGLIGIDDPVNNMGAVQTDIDYNFDGVNNRTLVTTNGAPEGYFMDNVNPPADYQMNQYTSVGADNYTYDANGNMTHDGRRNFDYQYDYQNRLIKVTNAATSTIVAEYVYDTRGRRLQRNVGGVITNFVYDGWREIEERDGANNVLTRYVYGNGIDEVLQMERGGNTYYYHENSLGSISHVTDASGNVVEKYDYDPFGHVTIRDGSDAIIPSSSIGNPYLFTGRRLDPETGLYYYRNRYYDPLLGRFISRDPIGDWTDGMNLGNGFGYAGNNGMNCTDPMGKECYFEDAPTGGGIPERYAYESDEEYIYRAYRDDPYFLNLKLQELGLQGLDPPSYPPPPPPRWRPPPGRILPEIPEDEIEAIHQFALSELDEKIAVFVPFSSLIFDVGYKNATWYVVRGVPMEGGEFNYYGIGVYYAYFGFPWVTTLFAIQAWNSTQWMYDLLPWVEASGEVTEEMLIAAKMGYDDEMLRQELEHERREYDEPKDNKYQDSGAAVPSSSPPTAEDLGPPGP